MLFQIHQRHRPRAAAEPGTSLIALDILTSHPDLHQKQSKLMICPADAEWQVAESHKLERIAQMRAFLRQLSLPVAKQVVNQTVCPSAELLVAGFSTMQSVRIDVQVPYTAPPSATAQMSHLQSRMPWPQAQAMALASTTATHQQSAAYPPQQQALTSDELLMAAKLARLSGLCYRPTEQLLYSLRAEGFSLVAEGRNSFTRYVMSMSQQRNMHAGCEGCPLMARQKILQAGVLTGCSASAGSACCCRWYIAEGRLQVGPADVELQASQPQDGALQQHSPQTAEGVSEAHSAQGGAQAKILNSLARPDATERPAQSQAAISLELQHQGPVLSVGGISPQQAVGAPLRCTHVAGHFATGNMHTCGGHCPTTGTGHCWSAPGEQLLIGCCLTA